MKFAHLHGHSTYSFLDGYGTPDQIASRMIEIGHTCSTMTDHGNIYGHVPFQKSMSKAGLRPLFGCEFYVVDDMLERTKYNPTLGVDGNPHVTVLAKTQEGYENLVKLVTMASCEGFYYYPRIDWKTIAKYQKGLVVLSGCVGGYPSRLVLAKDRSLENAIEAAWAFCADRQQQIENYYMELVPEPGMTDRETGEPIDSVLLSLMAIAKDLSLPMVMTADAHFPRREDHKYEDIMVCIGMGTTLANKQRYIRLPEYQYYCTADELLLRAMECIDEKQYTQTIHDDFVEAICLTADIAEQCQVEIPKAKPVAFYGRSVEEDPSDVLWKQVEDGINARKTQGTLPIELEQLYRERAEREFKVIAGKGFADYLLTISDIARWAKAQNTLVMCRGSAGGCLLLWLLRCSETDSIRHTLSFERFYDETRSDPPDVDMDFETWFRPKVIEYIYSKYGRDRCSQVAALTLLRAKNALSDVASVYGIPAGEYASLSAELDSKDDEVDKQMDAVTDPEALAVLAKWPQLRDATKLVGQVRQSSVNAAGFIISSEPLNKVIALITHGKDVQFSSVDKHGAADIGLLKLDLLGVAAFDVLGHAVRKMGMDFEDLYKMPVGDQRDMDVYSHKYKYYDGEEHGPSMSEARRHMEIPWQKSYDLVAKRSVVGVFQIDGSVMRVAEKAGLDRFEELYAASALCRPGAMDHVPEYAKNKHSASEFATYLSRMHPIAAEIVRTTYGILVYQEQVMAICRLMGKMPWPQIHKLRKRIASASFHGFELGPEYSDDFFRGCTETGVAEGEARFWWDAIKAHGIYCISGDTLLDRGGSGIHGGGTITIAEYFKTSQEKEYVPRPERGPHIMQNRYTGFAKKFRGGKCNLLQMDADGRIRPGQVLEIVYNGKATTFEVKTSDGNSIRITSNHRMMTQRGYVQCSDLTLDDEFIVMGDYEITTITSQSKWGQTPQHISLAVSTRANGKCECCGETGSRFEAAHMLDFDDCGNDYDIYHSLDNIQWLCNSCHKSLDYIKGERVKRWSKGRSTYTTKIVSIDIYGVEDTYCVVMGTQGHNFIANGFVSHNSFNKSHCVTYGIVGYWMLWLKANHPERYYESFLRVEGAATSPNPVLMKRLSTEYIKSGGQMVLVHPEFSMASFDSPCPGLIVGGWGNIHGVGEKTAATIMANGPYETWQDVKPHIGKALYSRLQASGLIDGDEVDVQSGIALANWMPVPRTGEKEKQTRDLYKLTRPGQLPSAAINGDLYVGGYLTAKYKKGRTGTFRGEQILWVLEDETGICIARVSRKLYSTIGQRLKKCSMGDYIAVSGWWTGEALFIKEFVIISHKE